ncbi:hypothetical protein [Streptacidiphilus jiangxiensis]|uniref:Antitoxin VbhA domain-containing protein n=1 Tax=Streptacidiphilus jiangxiensis TaxID=235985 RepID=A0A1H7UT23_STRJI|nr:hypothetical protein [Streptacidiphilus jiangxiensis]SEM00132.1 hypothetical protein SAMN05414137_116149 [Streptacidiphilus jiangxiensis]
MRDEQTEAEQRRDAVLERVGQELLAGRSPRQAQLADGIYRRLKDGARVEDVRNLIDDLSRVATDDFRRRAREGK